MRVAKKLSDLFQRALQGSRGEAVRGRLTNGMVGFVLFSRPVIAECVPTVLDRSRVTETRSSSLLPVESWQPRLRTVGITGYSHSRFASVTEGFHKPPVIFGVASNCDISKKSLPPAPGALLMVLTGRV